MRIIRKKRLKCKSCSSYLQEWGITSSGKKRYYCKKCKLTKLYQQKNARQDLFLLFKQYVLNGITYEMLSVFSGYSIRQLTRIFHPLFETDPPALPIPPSPISSFPCLLVDGLWFGRWFVLMVYRQSKKLTIIYISTAGHEVTTKIEKDLKYVLSLGYIFSGVVSDGGTGVVSAIKTVLRFTPHQICLAHMHRDITASIGKRSKDYRIQELRALSDHLWLIESKEALRWWRKKLHEWIQMNHEFLEEWRTDDTGRGWYVHKGVRKAVRILQELPCTSFKFLDYPLLPKTTNELEAQFGHLGKRWLAHRGLKRSRWKQFLKWFVYFYNQKKLSQKKN